MLVPINASVHIHGSEARNFKREADAYEARIDARTTSKQETSNPGISVGDFVVFDPRVETGPAGFIRLRHLG